MEVRKNNETFVLKNPLNPVEQLEFKLGLQYLEDSVENIEEADVDGYCLVAMPNESLEQANRFITNYGLRSYLVH